MLAPSGARHEGLEKIAGSTRPHPLAGCLEGVSVPDLVWQLCREGKTGILRFRRSGVTRGLFFDEGRIVFATSDDSNERLGEMLVRDGLLTLEQFESATAQIEPGRRLGSILVEAGALTHEDLVQGVLAQVRGIVLGLFSWEAGEYDFEPGPLPQEEIIQLGVHTGELIMQGVRQIRSFSLIRRGVGSGHTRYALVPDWRSRSEGIVLTDGENLLLECLDRGARTVEKLCEDVYLSNFEIYQSLWAFRILGLVERAERGRDEEQGRTSGALDQQEFLAVLVRLCRERETGVLHASRGVVERTFHIKEGRCTFATSSSTDDGLVAHLLRRGVISLQDREEVSRRLLTNRRVGRLLLEMGVIDEADLATAVREQVSEIVYDTVRWHEGEWEFAPGELPTLEEIILDRSLEDLVLRAARHVTSWSRIVQGVGGPDTALALTPKYLEVLDRTSIGGDEWDIVASLGVPRSVREVCHAHTAGDFRICQMLWALKLLGAVGEVPPSIPQPEVAPSVAEVIAPSVAEVIAPRVEEAVEPVVATIEEPPAEAPSEPPPIAWQALHVADSGEERVGDLPSSAPEQSVEPVEPAPAAQLPTTSPPPRWSTPRHRKRIFLRCLRPWRTSPKATPRRRRRELPSAGGAGCPRAPAVVAELEQPEAAPEAPPAYVPPSRCARAEASRDRGPSPRRSRRRSESTRSSSVRSFVSTPASRSCTARSAPRSAPVLPTSCAFAPGG
jgi:hypothetical protein